VEMRPPVLESRNGDYNSRMAPADHGAALPVKAEDVRLVVDTIPGLVWSIRPHGSAEFSNHRWLESTGLSAEQALDWGWKVAIHSDDLPRVLETFNEALKLGRPYEVEGRFRRLLDTDPPNEMQMNLNDRVETDSRR
jgi:PAS domain-containing protein